MGPSPDVVWYNLPVSFTFDSDATNPLLWSHIGSMPTFLSHLLLLLHALWYRAEVYLVWWQHAQNDILKRQGGCSCVQAEQCYNRFRIQLIHMVVQKKRNGQTHPNLAGYKQYTCHMCTGYFKSSDMSWISILIYHFWLCCEVHVSHVWNHQDADICWINWQPCFHRHDHQGISAKLYRHNYT